MRNTVVHPRGAAAATNYRAVGTVDIVHAVDIVRAAHAVDIVHAVHTLDIAIAIVIVIALAIAKLAVYYKVHIWKNTLAVY